MKANREVDKKINQHRQVPVIVISDLEILEVIELELNSNGGIILNMSDIHTTYVNILEENGFRVPENPRYKQYLKQLIQDNITDVHFNRPLDKTKPEQVLSTKSKEEAVSIYAKKSENVKEDLQILMSAAKILRKELANSPSWKFTGTFDDYSPPQILYSFCKHVIQGTGKIQTERRETSLNQSASIIAQHFVQAYKSDRQISHEPKNDECDFRYQSETLLSAGHKIQVAHYKTQRNRSIYELFESDGNHC